MTDETGTLMQTLCGMDDSVTDIVGAVRGGTAAITLA